MRRFRWAFLVLEEHPYGREMLGQLLAAGFVPELMIEECSSVADEEREKFLVRIHGHPVPKTFDELLAGAATKRVRVANHNDKDCERALAELEPDLIVLGGTRILRPRIFEKARDHTLNAHPGLLPELRGSASVAWAVLLDLPVGCTTHVIDRNIDTGAVVERREIPVEPGATYEDLCYATNVLSGTLMTEALAAYATGTLRLIPQPAGEPAHRNMPDAMVAEVKRKLAEGRYRP